jgi:hypothetical protein
MGLTFYNKEIMAVKTFGTEVLTSADTNTYLANSGLVYVKSQTVGTAVSSVAVSSAFSTDFDSYRIIYTGGVMSTSQYLAVTLGSTTSNYYNALVYGAYTGGSPAVVGNSAGAAWTYMGYGSTTSVMVVCDLYQPFLTKNTLMSSPHVQFAGGVGGTNQGILIDTTSYTSFTITTAGGTLTGGTITVYGYRKA